MGRGDLYVFLQHVIILLAGRVDVETAPSMALDLIYTMTKLQIPDDLPA